MSKGVLAAFASAVSLFLLENSPALGAIVPVSRTLHVAVVAPSNTFSPADVTATDSYGEVTQSASHSFDYSVPSSYSLGGSISLSSTVTESSISMAASSTPIVVGIKPPGVYGNATGSIEVVADVPAFTGLSTFTPTVGPLWEQSSRFTIKDELGATVFTQFIGLFPQQILTLAAGRYTFTWTQVPTPAAGTLGSTSIIGSVAIPEPATFGLIAVASAATLARRRRL